MKTKESQRVYVPPDYQTRLITNYTKVTAYIGIREVGYGLLIHV